MKPLFLMRNNGRLSIIIAARPCCRALTHSTFLVLFLPPRAIANDHGDRQHYRFSKDLAVLEEPAFLRDYALRFRAYFTYNYDK